MQRKTLFILAGVVAAAGVGVWLWQRKAVAAAGAGSRAIGCSVASGGPGCPVRTVSATGVRTTLLPGAPGYADLRVQANAIELQENTGAGHF